MFNWTEQPINKGRIQQLIIEFEPLVLEDPPEDINGDVSYQLGYLDGADFVPVKNATLHFGQTGVIQIVSAIQGTTTPAQAKAAVEALLINALPGAS